MNFSIFTVSPGMAFLEFSSVFKIQKSSFLIKNNFLFPWENCILVIELTFFSLINSVFIISLVSLLVKRELKETKNKIHEANSYIILKYNLNGELIGTYEGTRDASKSVKKENGSSSIAKCCRGEQKTAYGYIWKYKQDI